jgi:hypothetical protein
MFALQLTDAQVMTLAIAIIVPLSLLIYSNSRISDAKETLRAETAKLAVELRSEMKDFRNEMELLRRDMELLRRDMNAGFERMENALKIHLLEHHK